MAKKKRRVKKSRVLLLMVCLLLFLVVSFLGIYQIIYLLNRDDKEKINISSLSINELNFDDVEEFDLNLYSKSYMLIRLNDFKVLYGKNIDSSFYPASLTKVLTLDTVVNNVDDLNDTSYLTSADYNLLINKNASLAYLSINEEYTIEDLLYALVLPSGGDGALALENYFSQNNKDLVSMLNERCSYLGLNNSHFTNTTGLHDDELYTSLNDYSKIVIDCLNNDVAKKILKSFSHTLSDGLTVKSTLRSLENKISDIEIYGGKTGFTGQAGENIMVLFSYDNRSYLLILTGALGNPYNYNEDYHIQDVISVLEYFRYN